MVKELIKINGTKEVNGKQIKVIEGGFGENQKCMLASDIAIQHEVENKYIQKLINNNITRFNDNDLIDLKSSSLEEPQLLSMGFSKMQISKSKNIFLLSERGYTKLVAMMDNSNEKKWEIMDSLIDNYFAMRQILNADEQLKANLLLSIYSGGQEGILACKELTELEVEKATKPLLDKIEEDKPLVEFTETVLKSSDNILVRELAKIACNEGIKIGQNKLYEKLRSWGYIFKKSREPYQQYVDKGYFYVKETPRKTPYGVTLDKTTLVTPLGQIKIIERLRKEFCKAS